jgi:hypothetical protein
VAARHAFFERLALVVARGEHIAGLRVERTVVASRAARDPACDLA